MAACKTVNWSKHMWQLFIFTVSKEKYRMSVMSHLSAKSLPVVWALQVGQDDVPILFLPSFALNNTNPPSPSHVQYFMPPPSPINAHIKWILFIHTQHLSSHFTLPPACLSALGYGETWRHTLFFLPSRFPFCLLFSPPTTAGSSWPLIYEGLLNPCGSVWSTQGNFGVRWGSVVKTEVIYSSTCLMLLGLVRMLLEAPSANCSIWLQAFVGVCV